MFRIPGSKFGFLIPPKKVLVSALLLFCIFYCYQSGSVRKWINFYYSLVLAAMNLDSNFQTFNLSFQNGNQDQACPIPQLEPYAQTVKSHLKRKPILYSCQVAYPLLFNSTLDGYIIPAVSLEKFKKHQIQSCWYQVIKRVPRKGDAVDTWRLFHAWKNNNLDFNLYDRMKKKHRIISLQNATKIPPTHEFIAILCSKGIKAISNDVTKIFKGVIQGPEQSIVDMHAFISSKPKRRSKHLETNEALNSSGINRNDSGSRRKVNVLVFGIDGVSRMNFLRTMPKSYGFLMNLSAVEMQGYNKVGDNTFPNVVPMLTSLSSSQIADTCGSNKTYDNCPMIWNRYSKNGYATSYAEDANYINMFYFERKGFIKRQTDYYFRAFGRAAESKIGHQQLVSAWLCYGPRLSFEVLLQNMKKFVFQMTKSNQSFFQFTWATALTHDFISASEIGDEYLLRAIKWLQESGYLNDTVFILMSDHGNRVDKFRNTFQGQLEDRLPFAMFLLPEWMKSGKFHQAYQNLVGNRKRLVTTFDFHEVLVDLLHLETIENDSINERQLSLSEAEKHGNVPRGISLFLPISKARTCKMAGIERFYCSCNYLKSLVPSNAMVQKAATFALLNLNHALKYYKKCAPLHINSIKLAQHAGKRAKGWEGYLVNFETQPGGALFEALVGITGKSEWKIEGAITRTNSYKNDSFCVKDATLKPFCYCL